MNPQMAALMAQYNRWMNEHMFEAAGRLGADELARERGAFFGSILGTLNHIAVADMIWLNRFAAHPAQFAALREMSKFPRPSSLRQTVAPQLPALLALRQQLDGVILRWVAELTPEQLASSVTYATTAGVASSKNLGALLQHFFNHQTHHRGQVSTLLFQAGVDVGVTDLAALIPNERQGSAP
jgi:uncharacterized damage-inducible protein DinB